MKSKIIFLLLPAFLFISSITKAQIFGKKKNDEDTVIHINLDTVVIEERSLQNYNYSRYKYVVNKMYPLADTAIQLFTEIETAASEMKHREEKNYKKEMEKELKAKFEDRLKNLSRTEGSVLIDIIERNTNRSLYDILKDVKSGSTAFWWQNMGRFYGYNLKDRYNPDNNMMLETIIAEYEQLHKIERKTELNQASDSAK